VDIKLKFEDSWDYTIEGKTGLVIATPYSTEIEVDETLTNEWSILKLFDNNDDSNVRYSHQQNWFEKGRVYNVYFSQDDKSLNFVDENGGSLSKIVIYKKEL
jgi:hypothetical protein